MVNGSLEFTSSISAIVDLTILLLEIRGFFSIFWRVESRAIASV